jgi:phosphoserine phosphatase
VPRFSTVVFDCDSTLSAVEGIDELAGPHRASIAALTDAAMRGELLLEEVYGRRLALVRPSRGRLAALGGLYVERLVPDARETVAALRAEGIAVRIVSGGLRPAVLAVARALEVPDDHVAAVDVRFDRNGEYAGWDDASPLAYTMGKRAQLESWGSALVPPVMIVGDGITDLEARPPADAFIAFAGVIAREAVIAAADAVVRERSLAPVLALALGGTQPRSSEGRALLARVADEMSGRIAVQRDDHEAASSRSR